MFRHLIITAALLGAAFTAPAAASDPRTVVFDLAPFTPFAVWGEIFGVGTEQGEVVNARLDVTFVSNEPDDWSLWVHFVDFPMPGFLGVDSVVEGWSGVGTFHKSFESDALNGTLAPPPGETLYTWFMQWAGGTPVFGPGGQVSLVPVDGEFTELKLTLFLAPCPDGDPAAPWTDVGGAIPGGFGTPELTAAASLCPDEPGTLRLENALPGASSLLVLGTTALNAPLYGGTLVPHPDVVLPPLPVQADGSQQLAFTWPLGVPTGIRFWLQAWVADGAAVQGWSASNGLEAIVP